MSTIEEDFDGTMLGTKIIEENRSNEKENRQVRHTASEENDLFILSLFIFSIEEKAFIFFCPFLALFSTE